MGEREILIIISMSLTVVGIIVDFVFTLWNWLDYKKRWGKYSPEKSDKRNNKTKNRNSY